MLNNLYLLVVVGGGFIGFWYLMARSVHSKKEWKAGEQKKTVEALTIGVSLLFAGFVLFALLEL